MSPPLLLPLLAVLAALASVAGATPASTASLWPLPQSVSTGNAAASLAAEFSVLYAAESPLQADAVLDAAMKRFSLLLSSGGAAAKDGAEDSGVLAQCAVNVQQGSEQTPLTEGVDESYTLTVPSAEEDGAEVTLQATTVWGALRGLQTLSQLAVVVTEGDAAAVKSDGRYYEVNELPITVQDAARFAHRGVLADTSRHYLHLDTLRHAVDAMEMTKMNVLHVHFVDAESFPVDTVSAPKLVEGAYSPQATFSLDQLADLEEYARMRGVRIVPEIDIPGHAYSWGTGYPDILTDCPTYSYNINDFPLNPAKQDALDTANAVLSDVTSTFANAEYMHIGGDEVVYACWAEDATVVDFMNANGWTNYDDLLNYFFSQVLPTVEAAGKTPVFWEEAFEAGVSVPSDAIFQVWKTAEEVSAIAQAGYRVIASPQDPWYLASPDNTWQAMYAYEPTTNLTTSQAELLLGGETAMWGEHADDSNWPQFVWPRAAAVGERLWSAEDVTDVDDAEARLTLQRCRMLARGVPSSPIGPSYCDGSLV